MLYAGLDLHSKPLMAYSATGNGHVSNTVREAVREILDYTVLPKEFSFEAMNLTTTTEKSFVHDEAQVRSCTQREREREREREKEKEREPERTREKQSETEQRKKRCARIQPFRN